MYQILLSNLRKKMAIGHNAKITFRIIKGEHLMRQPILFCEIIEPTTSRLTNKIVS